MKNKPNRRRMKRLIKKMQSKATHLWLSKPMAIARTAIRVSMYPPFLWEAGNAKSGSNSKKIIVMRTKQPLAHKQTPLIYAAKSFILTSAIVYDGVIRELTHQQASFKQPVFIAQNERAIGFLKQQYLNKKIRTY